MTTPKPVEGVDPAVRDFLLTHDPTAGMPTNPLPVTADQIIAAAESRSATTQLGSFRPGHYLFGLLAQARRFRVSRASGRWLIPSAAALILMVTLGFVGFTARQRSQEQPAARLVPVILQFEHQGEDAGPPARQYLADLAGRVKSLPSHPPRKRYTYVHLQTWSRDNTAPPGSQDEVVAHDLRVWWAGDHSGRRWDRTLPGQSGAVPAQWLDNPPADSRGAPKDFGPGGIGVIVERDPSILVFNLAGQLSVEQPITEGPQYTVRAVAGMHRFHYLSPQQRIAVLQVLSDASGLTYRGRVTDRAGRPGHAVSVDSGTEASGRTREVLVFDDATGHLLSYEEIALSTATGSTAPRASVRSYVLYLERSYVERLP